MIRRAGIALAITLFGLMFAGLVLHHVERRSLPPLGKRYVEHSGVGLVFDAAQSKTK